jgi:diacylglycerol kinase
LGAALSVTLLLKPGWIWVAGVALSVAVVLAAELVNSAFEAMLDRVHPEAAPQIKLAKDIAAAAVLTATLGAVVVAVAMALQLFLS